MEKTKEIKLLYAPTLLSLVSRANKIPITKDKIINVLEVSGQFAMIYYD